MKKGTVTASMLGLGFLAGAGMMCVLAFTDSDAVAEPTPAPTETVLLSNLPPCPTEDSTGCYWDADVQGNGEGIDVVTQPEGDSAPVWPSNPSPVHSDHLSISEPQRLSQRPADTDRATGPVHTYDTNVLFCGVNAGVATDTDPYGNTWAYCEPALAE